MNSLTPLKLALLQSGRPQRHWARLAEMSAKKLSDLAQGWGHPTPRERDALATLLDVPVEDLFPPKDEEKENA